MVSFGRQGAGHEEESADEAEGRRLAAIREALTKTEGKDLGEQAEAVADVMLAEPTQSTTDWMWRALVVGLFALLITTLIAVIVLVAIGKGTQALTTIFGVIFGGLIGIFVPGPNGAADKG